MWITRRLAGAAALLSGASLVMPAGCGKSASPPAEASAAAPAARAEPAKRFNTGSIFPEGPGRELVVNNCGSCHSLVCAALGQRTAARWESIREDHRDKLTATRAADLKLMFSYLAANFNETKPEPQVPAAMLQQGCTPF